MDQSKDKIKAALLGELIRYMGKSMVSSLADPEEKEDEYESEAPEAPEAIVAVATPEEADSEEMDMDEKKKRMHKLKKMAEEC